MSALDRLKQNRAQRHKERDSAVGNMSAAQSHLANDRYMRDFEAAFEALHGPSNTCDAAPTYSQQQLELSTQQTGLDSSKFSRPDVPESPCTTTLTRGWLSGPIDEAGVQLDLSDRPTVCSAASWSSNEVVVGSTDHALYVIDVERGKKKRQLYNKSNGHSEWVTCVTYLPTGSILSGGMDSKLCLWSGTRASDLTGHTGPISQVTCDARSGIAISASYDKSIRLWDSRGRSTGCMLGHSAPVLELQANGSCQVISGDRSGCVQQWDLGTGDSLWTMKGVHRGHITALAWMNGSKGNAAWAGCFASGGQDGYFRLWDPRARSNPVKLGLHLNDSGHGALTGIIAGGQAASYTTATCGADGTVRFLDMRSTVQELACINLTDFPYSFTAVGTLVLAGCGDGSVHVLDLATLETAYALGANQHAVRTMDASSDRLVCSGDDGNVLIYHFL